ncbi:hypothetical protein AB9N12_02150 [Bacteroides sp. AN502(2024)]|uniref:hypothetical protein n=1 Tax=Bacteroides sp. AN502(2024) TaxID=3160599 RepID=UPI003517DE07
MSLKALLKANVYNSGSFYTYFQQRLYYSKTEPAFHGNRASVITKQSLHFTSQQIVLPASLKKLKALKALSLAYNTFLQGSICSAFSRYLLLAKRLRKKLKPLKADYSMKIQDDI